MLDSCTGFEAIGDSKLTSDGGWGCMIRSSQMIVAQVLTLFFYKYHFGLCFERETKFFILLFTKFSGIDFSSFGEILEKTFTEG